MYLDYIFKLQDKILFSVLHILSTIRTYIMMKQLSEKRALSFLIATIIPHLLYRSVPTFLMTLLSVYDHINTILVMLQDYTVVSLLIEV